VVGIGAEGRRRARLPGGACWLRRVRRALRPQPRRQVAQLVDWSPNAEEVVADAVRSVFGADGDDLSTDDALDRLLNPARNPYRLDTIQVAYHSPLMRSLQHASYTFRKRLSHTADSQDQRHRMVPGSRPLMTLSDTVRPDYVTPRLIRPTPPRWPSTGGDGCAWSAKNRLLAWAYRSSSPRPPNAKVVRFVESGLIALLHKWTMRTSSTRGDLRGVDGGGAGRAVHPAWRASSVRPASSGTAWSRRGAPKAASSAACPSGATFPTPCALCSGSHLRHAPDACPTCAARTVSLMAALKFTYGRISLILLGLLSPGSETEFLD
jgi:hypothetical protein